MNVIRINVILMNVILMNTILVNETHMSGGCQLSALGLHRAQRQNKRLWGVLCLDKRWGH